MAISFDAVDDVIDWGDIAALDGLSALTVSLWAYVSGSDLYATLVGDDGTNAGWRIALNNPATNLLLTFRNGAVTHGQATGNPVPADTWTHLFVYYDGSQATDGTKLRLWVDGTEKTLTYTAPIPTSLGDNTAALRMGNWTGDATLFFGGRLAEVGIWAGEAFLDAGTINALAKGYSPDAVRPDGLDFYTPLIRNVFDKAGLAGAPSITGTGVAVHPRVIYPSRAMGRRFTTAAAGDTLFAQALF